jgi:ABC-type dipeptide/oligopeptide/nickel transport system ATPase component
MNLTPAPQPSSEPLIRIRDLRISFRRHGAEPFEAVKGIDLDLQPGESMAIVGESGSGKSVTALSFARLLPEPPAKIEAAEFSIAGRNMLKLAGKELRKIRGKEVAYVFQEPSTSLNPVLTVRTQMAEALELHRPEVTNREVALPGWHRGAGKTPACLSA